MAANKGLVIGISVLAVAGVGVAGFYAVKKMQGPVKPQYLTEAAVVGDVEEAVLATGSLTPADVVNVGAETNGRVQVMRVKLGDFVHEGDVIASLDPSNLQNLLRQQENTIQQQESNLRDRLAQLDVTKAQVNRQKALLEKGATSQVQYDQANAQLGSAMAQIENQRSQIENARIQLEQRRNDVEKANVRAPMDGIIAEVVSRQGQTINNNQTVPVIARLAKMDEMTVRTQVSEADIIKVHPGQKVYFTILGEPTKRYYATLKTRELTPAGGVLDSAAGGLNKGAVYYNVLFNVPNEDGKLFPSMTAEVHVVLAEAQHVVTISAVALGPKGPDGYNTVQVVKPDGSLETRKVLVGVNNNYKAEIKSGLKVGEKVVTGQANATPATAATTDAGGKGLLGGMGVQAP